MDTGKLIIGILAAVGLMALCATLFRSFWMAILTGGPIMLGVFVVAVFLLGVFLGSNLRR